MATGAKPSDRVYKFLATAGVVAAKSVPAQTKAHLPSEKTQMRAKDKEAKLAKAAEEKAAAKAEAEKPAEAPAEAPAPAAETAPETPAAE